MVLLIRHIYNPVVYHYYNLIKIFMLAVPWWNN